MSYTKNYSTNYHVQPHGDINNMPKIIWADKKLKSTLLFLAFPAIFIAIVMLTGVKAPGWVLYGFAIIMGVVLFIHTLRDQEWVQATFVLYMPLTKLIVIPIAPGVNGTNILVLLLIFSLMNCSRREERPLFKKYPYSRLIKWWWILSCFSAITLIMSDGGLSYLIEDVAEEYKGWIDQLLVFILFLNLIRDGAMARRMVIYMMLGTMVVLALGIQEWLSKSGLATIEKSRLFGPQKQPNDFGAFLVYNISPFIGISILYMTKLRIWALMPMFAIYAKILLATFSRGAYVGMGVAAVMAGYVRGKTFLSFMALMAIIILVNFPELVPKSLQDRFAHTSSNSIKSQQRMDSSSQTRLILWDAATDMTLESPLLGKGFKAFPRIKSEYTKQHVEESDPHNMYFFISSQMGIPALILFLLILYRKYTMSANIARNHQDHFARAIGIGGVAMVGGIAAVNIFGSRMVNIEVCGYFWIYLAIIMHITTEFEKKDNKDNQLKEVENA